MLGEMTELPADVRTEAARRLDAIEVANGVRIVLAVESGSRAWGFPSPDSDYDVRFIYICRVSDYLRLDPLSDVIESPIDGDWDVNGWDLRKAIQQLRRGNAVVAEWLRSPLVYRDVGPVAEALREISARHASLGSAVRHYYGLLSGQHRRDFVGRKRLRLKKYFYAVRAAAALAWIRELGTHPPMALPELLEGGVAPAGVIADLGPLLEAKLRSSEVGEGPRIASLDAFIDEALAWGGAEVAQVPQAPEPALTAELEDLFLRSVLRDPLAR
jgi:predicted nucleotidyltransferase